MSSDTDPGPGADRGGPSLADRVAAAVLGVTGVHALHAGVLGEVATYLPGRRVPGIRLREAMSGASGASAPTEVHVVLDWDSPALATADAVRARLEGLVRGPVHVVVEDVTDPDPALASVPAVGRVPATDPKELR